MDREQRRSGDFGEHEAEKEEGEEQLRSVEFEEEMGVDEWVIPGVPIVRSSTPRPQSFEIGMLTSGRVPVVQRNGQEGKGSATFPVEAPSAPPLPEEDVEAENESAQDTGKIVAIGTTPLPLEGKAEPVEDTGFVWLFEYGLEMDGAVLNSTDRLDGLALLYGPAVLKGYELTFDVLRTRAGEVVATILPSRLRGVEVWGVLYRVPQRVVVRQGDKPALLDEVHAATPPDGLFERLQIVVHEAYRARELTCITYIASATARNQFHLLPRDKQVPEPAYVERLLACAQKQKLPGSYLDDLMALAVVEEPQAHETVVRDPLKQNTEPLPIVAEVNGTTVTLEMGGSGVQPKGEQKGPEPKLPTSIGLVVFAIYLVVMVLVVFVLAVLQGLGFGGAYLTANFLLLGVPWFVLVYGMIGGCLSSLIALSRGAVQVPQNFVLVTWFVRPFVGALLASVAYLLLNSGLFVFNGSVAQHAMLNSLLAIVAGACEGWLFQRKR